jgi:RNA polymerase sigma-70 factor (ECF subfamily)
MAMSDARNVQSLVDHFFRHQSGKLVAVLTRVFGLHNFELVEDVVQASLIEALEAWKIQGMPENPSAWMYRVARNKALDVIRRRNVADRLDPEWMSLRETASAPAEIDRLFLSNEITDSQLRMMFTCCHPELAEESQIALTLKTLCGFSTHEIARSLLTTEANVKKRISRAKRKFVDKEIEFEVPAGDALKSRLGSVHTVLYLLFNEGYSSSQPHELIRRDLCEEAMRLCLLLFQHPASANPETAALLALMLLHASRFDARLDECGNMLLLEEQDRRRWNRELIALGIDYLNQSASGERISRYHLEAAIAAQHSLAPSFSETEWPAILTLYDDLTQIYPSPIHELNRAIAVAQVSGPDAGIKAIQQIKALHHLQGYHLLHATLGEFHRRAGRGDEARGCFLKAMECTDSVSEKRLLERKLHECDALVRFTEGEIKCQS